MSSDQDNSRAFLFPGQGAQKIGMAVDLCESVPRARAIFDRGREVLGFDVLAICKDGPEDELNSTRVSQPAIFLHSMAMLEVMGVTVLQGWGMTETTGPLAVCSPKDRRRGAFGTCGELFPNARAVIEGEELIVEGPQNASGYVEPDATVVPFHGRKHTGDRGGFDVRRRLLVLGKVSDRITTDNGLNYLPVPMEDDLKASDLNRRNVLEEAVVIGDARPRLGCVFFLREGVEKTDDVEGYLSTLIRDHNGTRSVDEQIGPWTVSPDGLKEAGGLGPSGKLVRRRIEEGFAAIYGEVLA